jgi:ribosomal protein S18 acetylase RimI-like enzyme
MGVLESYRHQGIGTRLITAALNRAKARGLERVELEVFDSNVPAIDLYEKMGFSREGIKIASVRIDGVDFNTVQMALFLKDFPRADQLPAMEKTLPCG